MALLLLLSLAVIDAHDPLRFIGTVIQQRYRVVSFLGEGSMSRVFEVADATTGRIGAMKILLADLEKDAEVAARLVREGKTMGMFSHPNIVELLDVGVLEDGRPFIVTELARGLSLRGLLDAGPVDALRALAIIRQVLQALEHAHGHGVIHRDIKPENIWLVDGRDDALKVLDFGIAKLVDDTRAVLGEATLTRAGYDVFGSPHYIAPECVVGRPVDARTDIYSTGAVLFELLAGRPPFDDADPLALLRLQASAKAPTLAACAPERTFTPELEFLVAEALAKEPSRRFASATDMIALIDAARASLEAPRGDTLIANAAAIAMPPMAPSAAPTFFDIGMAPRVRAASSLPARMNAWARSTVRSFKRIPPPRRFAILCGVGLAAIFVIALAVSGADAAPTRAAAASSATSITDDDANALVERGDAEFARGRYLDALAAYEQAIARSSKLGTDSKIRTNATAIVNGKDSVAAVVALELLATRVEPRAHDEIAQATHAKTADIRRRAFAIAERDGFAASIDHVESALLDLSDAKTCDERRAAIESLQTTSDHRAIGAIRRARDKYPCVKREATDALAVLEAKS